MNAITPEGPSGLYREERYSYSIDEAVKFTGLGRTTIYRLISEGDLPSSKIGRRRIIRSSDLRALIDRGCT